VNNYVRRLMIGLLAGLASSSVLAATPDNAWLGLGFYQEAS
jgi:hypothetical protein